MSEPTTTTPPAPAVAPEAGGPIVVRTPDAERARIKQLAEAATPGPWRSVWDEENPDPHSHDEKCIITLNPRPDGYGDLVAGLVWYDGPHAGCTREDAAYIAAVSPDVTLATLAYVEHLEAHAAALATQLAEATAARVPVDFERAQALRDDVRRKYAGAIPGTRYTADWFRLEEVLNQADAQAKELATTRARLHDEQADSGERERQLLLRDEEIRKLYEVLQVAEYALGNCYDVTEWPANGESIQDNALRLVIEAQAKKPAAPLPEERTPGKEGEDRFPNKLPPYEGGPLHNPGPKDVSQFFLNGDPAINPFGPA